MYIMPSMLNCRLRLKSIGFLWPSILRSTYWQIWSPKKQRADVVNALVVKGLTISWLLYQVIALVTILVFVKAMNLFAKI